MELVAEIQIHPCGGLNPGFFPMSIINRMLQELDRRQGMSDPDAARVMPEVRVAVPSRKDREWFWRIVAGLMIAAVGWVAWIAWQLQPRAPIATEQAFKAAGSAQRKPAPAPTPVPSKPVPAQPAPAVKPAPEAVAAFKLAPAIESPIREQARKAAPREKRKAAAAPAPVPASRAVTAPARLGLDVPPALILQPPVQPAARVVKRDRTRSAEDRAESEYRRAASLLNQGRTGEAEEGFMAALASHPGHESARQALVSLYLEQRRIDDARRLLQEGMALNPANVRFASVLARIFVERTDYPAALEVLNATRGFDQGNPELHSLRGTVLQRLGRHADAAEAFQSSLRGAPQNGAAWMGLGISLESVGKKSEAADAFKRAASTGTLGPEARGYAEQRARQLQ